MFDDDYLSVAPEVAEALQRGEAVVALESTIISHGMPSPRNVETALAVEATVRERGAVPATVAVVDGRLTAGIGEDGIRRIGDPARVVAKTSRRDLPFIVTNRGDGATTVAATMIVAKMAGIAVFATGGIGGVHRGFEDTMDVSADLDELANTDVAVVCAGAKSILDIRRTLEYLETKGVPVVGFGTDELPAFYTRGSGYHVDYRVDSAAAAANAMFTKWRLGLRGGVVFANPIPAAAALDANEVDSVIENALCEMNAKGVSGKDTTPFLLAAVTEATGGRSLEANVALVMNNARVAADIAVEYARLQAEAPAR